MRGFYIFCYLSLRRLISCWVSCAMNLWKLKNSRRQRVGFASDSLSNGKIIYGRSTLQASLSLWQSRLRFRWIQFPLRSTSWKGEISSWFCVLRMVIWSTTSKRECHEEFPALLIKMEMNTLLSNENKKSSVALKQMGFHGRARVTKLTRINNNCGARSWGALVTPKLIKTDE